MVCCQIWFGCPGFLLEFEVKGKRKPGRPKKTWKMQVEKESKSVEFRENERHELREMENGS